MKDYVTFEKETFDKIIRSLNRFFTICVLLAFINLISVVCETYLDVKNYEPRIIKLEKQFKVKNKQIDGLHKQLRRTQYQLKKAKKQNVEQTQKIATLTGNGG
ncbi:hypothetical protein SuUB81_10040 [Streptococcus uberis]|uniref:hypothetical protein n=1 Tax=Streptococcus uberis TaxID=1349 RepID=UPI0033417930